MHKSFVDWPQISLGDVLEERTEIPNPTDIELGLIPIVSKIGFDAGKIELRQVGKTRTKMILIRPGDLVLSGINAAKGAIAICEEKIPISATIHYSSYKPKPKKIDILFLWYFLRNEVFREILKDNIPGAAILIMTPSLAQRYFNDREKDIKDSKRTFLQMNFLHNENCYTRRH